MLPLVGACAPKISIQRDTPAPAPAYTAFEESGKGWWQVDFQLEWDQEQQPSWHVDALLADQIMAPIVAGAEARILLWRFHRRAAPDDHGHRFSFVFYADAETAGIINDEVESSPITAQLQEAGIVRDVRLVTIDDAPAQDIGATRDPSWPDAIRRGWPWFIMGVSQSWLRLIQESKAKQPALDRAPLSNVLEYYRDIDEEVSTLWREHGQYAYLHHLNAVFGYQLLIIRETNLKRF
jgi:hypothetical protein